MINSWLIHDYDDTHEGKYMPIWGAGHENTSNYDDDKQADV